MEAVTPIAAAARARRLHLARVLAAVERGARSGESVAPGPPWALWHDPAAQAAYVAAESIADRLAGVSDLRAAIVAERAQIDRATVI